MAKSKKNSGAIRLTAHHAGDVVGIQVPVGRINAQRLHWQTVLDARSSPMIYRIYNSPSRGRGNVMLVEVDGLQRTIHVGVGTSVDVRAKRIRVKAGTGGATASVEGWYVLVS